MKAGFMLNRIYYESRIAGQMGPVSLLALQKKSMRRNVKAGITSFLFYDSERIFQVLEGDAEAIDKTMRRITANRLHEGVKIRAILRSNNRVFGHWPFGATHVRDPDFKRVMIASQQADFMALDVLQAERVLSIVASRKRRALKMDAMSDKMRQFGRKQAEQEKMSGEEAAKSP